jgi:AraC-like DNA-binding protein
MDNEIYKLDSVKKYNDLYGIETLNPLISVVDFSKFNAVKAKLPTRFLYELYAVFLKDVRCGDIHYGRQLYDYQEGTLVFFAPGQLVSFDYSKLPQEDKPHPCYGLLFHRDLLSRLSLARSIDSYSFFSYQSNEALHLSLDERRVIIDCIENIREEIHHKQDVHSRRLIVSNIELLLNYCDRFYDRQFSVRKKVNTDVLVKLEFLLDDYFRTDKVKEHGLPTVSYFADQLHLSPNYFGDLVKKNTSESPQKFIQNKLVEVAKERVLDTSKTLVQVSYELGFDYSQHFSRWFKKSLGCTPREYRKVT